jgi:hypothetical protein
MRVESKEKGKGKQAVQRKIQRWRTRKEVAHLSARKGKRREEKRREKKSGEEEMKEGREDIYTFPRL